MYGLKDSDLLKMQQVFVQFSEIDAVILYGSRAKGNFRNGSDIDITLLGNEVDIHTLLKIMTALDALDLPYEFDVSIYKNIENTELKAHIDRVGIRLYNAT
ncbi:nucleotidyltransferase domain-containing protein [Fusibacter ferrireducens]|uniref:Nucleotidyltransferase domain-containing protein n=1 Tax=Fusibacter ferrireducens TaxID=2785058 RepID=A0ABR9ZZ37_9FIRM|nr:nucleotidyltransferase domain-containing protein [Fusibacter ferrireducens]MBF4695160.1 nucleotidyltransferase domain-containing protein [Fusibacter ferrireducens]